MEKMSIAILCGGKSSRFKEDKAQFFMKNNPLFQNNLIKLRKFSNDIFFQGMIGCKFENNKNYCDEVSNKGALGGIYSAILNAKYNKIFILACDMPNFDINFIKELNKYSEEFNIVVAKWKNGFFEPLCAIYSKSIENLIKNMLESNDLKISNLFKKVINIKELNIEKLIENGLIKKDCFFNVNRIDDLR